MELHFFYDLVCPYAYLASTQVEGLAARTGARLVWRPFLLGGVFRALGTADDPNEGMSPAKARNNLRDMERWAEHRGVPLRRPRGHPRRTVLALRALLAAGEGAARAAATHALYRAYWVEGRDVEDPAVVAGALDAVGLHGSDLVARAGEQREALFRVTAEAAAAGVFGAPAFLVGDQLFWGQDRLHFVERALGGWKPAALPTDATWRTGSQP
jgi:2-hydroxychromene-2-carboxylate isomerase